MKQNWEKEYKEKFGWQYSDVREVIDFISELIQQAKIEGYEDRARSQKDFKREEIKLLVEEREKRLNT